MRRLMKTFLAVLVFLPVLLVGPRETYAQAAGPVSNDGALSAAQTLLRLVDQTKLPTCALMKQKGLKFCPLISKCSADKPFCVLKSEKPARSRRVKLSCVCSNSPLPIAVATPTPTPTATPTGTISTGVSGLISSANICVTQSGSGICRSPYVGEFDILDNGMVSLVFSGRTSNDGRFTTNLLPGSYVLQAGPLVTHQSNGLAFGPGERIAHTSFSVTSGNVVSVTLDVSGVTN